jgi:hypothetical protein
MSGLLPSHHQGEKRCVSSVGTYVEPDDAQPLNENGNAFSPHTQVSPPPALSWSEIIIKSLAEELARILAIKIPFRGTQECSRGVEGDICETYIAPSERGGPPPSSQPLLLDPLSVLTWT